MGEVEFNHEQDRTKPNLLFDIFSLFQSNRSLLSGFF